jgi:dipeptidyl aminopeptidase/acylaminoacyl peptidase
MGACRTLNRSARRLWAGAGWMAIALALAPGVTPARQVSSLHRFDEIALSKVGDRIASIEGEEGENGETGGESRVLIRSLEAGAAPRLLAECDDCSYSGLTFSPGGEALAFVRDDRHGHASLVVAGSDGKLEIARVEGILAAPRWSPDGRSIGVLVTIAARKPFGPTQPGVRLTGEIGADEDRQRLALVSLQTHELRILSAADLYVYDYDWVPDSSAVVASAAKGNGDDNWYLARILRMDTTSGASTEIAAPNVQLGFPRVSPDGTSVAFIGGLMSDYGCVGGEIYIVPLRGGELKNLTPGFDGSFRSLEWAGTALLATATRQDQALILRVQPGGQRQQLWSAPVAITSGGYASGAVFSARGDRVAAVVEDFIHGPEIVTGEVSHPLPLTHDNDGVPPSGQARSISWTNDGYVVQGWLISPDSPGGSAKHPLVVNVHGGPACHADPGLIWTGWTKSLLAKGYFLLYPNYRGSLGQGEAFKRSIIGKFGKGELGDILSGVAAAEREAPIDAGRVGITGHSNGGYLTMWAVTQTTKFKAAVAGAGLSNWTSYYGENGIDKWLLPYFGGPLYEHREAYRAASPIEFVSGVKTPTLMTVGERDIECPPDQSLEFWHALVELGVPTSLVIYPDEGHAIRGSEHVREENRRRVDWFEKYLH